MKKWIWITCLLLSAASAENSDRATLILYRQREFLGSNYDIKIDNKFVAHLGANTYIEVKLDPVITLIESSTYRGSKRTLRFQAEPNQTYYLKAYEEVDFWDRYLVMQMVEENLAKKEMIKCRKNKKVIQPD
jgi:hypothetical protein